MILYKLGQVKAVFPKTKVILLELFDSLSVGECVFREDNNTPIKIIFMKKGIQQELSAKPGDIVGINLIEGARKHDVLYKKKENQ